MTITSQARRRHALLAATALLVPSSAFATVGPVTAPAIPGVAALPGPIVAPGTPAATMPRSRPRPTSPWPGTMTTISGTGPAGEQEGQPHLEHRERRLAGRRASRQRRLPRSQDHEVHRSCSATAQTDATGAFSIKLAAPHDWGGLHDIYAVVDGIQVAKGGFLIARHATMTPKNGPDRHADHDHLLRARLLALRGLGARSTTTTSSPDS